MQWNPFLIKILLKKRFVSPMNSAWDPLIDASIENAIETPP